MTREEAVRKAQKQSFANQQGGVTIPARKLRDMVRIQLGFQPLGISSRPIDGGGTEILVANYYAPAVVRCEVTRDDAGLHFAVSHIRGAKGSTRCFPDISMPSGANRMQCAVRHPDGRVLVLRNGDHDFFALRQLPDGGWQFDGMYPLPEVGENQMVHSAVVYDEAGLHWLNTIESDIDCRNWQRRTYNITGRRAAFASEREGRSWVYGIAESETGVECTVTDFRCANKVHGIYLDDDLFVPDVCGSGIALLADGSALVATYGESFPEAFNGRPGELVYIPARLLK